MKILTEWLDNYIVIWRINFMEIKIKNQNLSNVFLYLIVKGNNFNEYLFSIFNFVIFVLFFNENKVSNLYFFIVILFNI